MSQQRWLLGNSEPESSSSCEQSEQPEEPAPMHNGLRFKQSGSKSLSNSAPWHRVKLIILGTFFTFLLLLKEETLWLDERFHVLKRSFVKFGEVV